MAIHAITFRIAADATYDERYESVVEAIRAESPTQWWAETTSFFLIESSSNSKQVADSINAKSSFAPARDLLLVINLSQRGFTPLGNVTDDDLRDLMGKR